MTAYEYADLAYTSLDHVHTVVALSLAILSGYLVIAYVIGSNLTRLQVSILNIAYATWWLYIGVSGYIYLIRSRSHLTLAAELDQHLIPPEPYFQYVFISVGLVLWLVSYWFMWSVRQPKLK